LTIDRTTGLPELPKGYFFRVHKKASYISYHYVTLFYKKQCRFLFWTYTKDVEQIFSSIIHPTLSEHNILTAAMEVVQKRNDWLARDSSLLGDYPPKKLEF
jgi:hypothetical protein